MKARFPRLQRDDAFTLVELIIGMAIVGLLVSAIGSALIVSMRTTNVTTATFDESHDAQLSSAYLANDIQSASSVEQPPTSAHCPGSGTPLIGFLYSNGQWACYFWAPTGAQAQVTRSFGGSTVVLAHFARTSNPPTATDPPTVKCYDSSGQALCSSTSLDTVRITFTESGTDAFGYTLAGSRRSYLSNVSTSGTTSKVSLWAFAQSSPLWIAGGCPNGWANPGNPNYDPTCDPSLNQNQGAKLVVNGNLLVNYPTPGPTVAVKISNKATLSVNNGVFKILQGGTCQGGGCNNFTCSQCSPPNTYGSYGPPPLLDPLRFMAAPTAVSSGSCNTATPMVCTPGSYASDPNINKPAIFQPGIYVFQGGLSFQGTANATSPNGGVLFYVPNGAVTFQGGALINLSPYASDPYRNILIFQGRLNSSQMKLSGGTAVNQARFLGIIYAPASSAVTLGAGGANLEVDGVVAQNIKITGNSQVTIGAP